MFPRKEQISGTERVPGRPCLGASSVQRAVGSRQSPAQGVGRSPSPRLSLCSEGFACWAVLWMPCALSLPPRTKEDTRAGTGLGGGSAASAPLVAGCGLWRGDSRFLPARRSSA